MYTRSTARRELPAALASLVLAGLRIGLHLPEKQGVLSGIGAIKRDIMEGSGTPSTCNEESALSSPVTGGNQ